MKVIEVTAQKGGVGTTTVACSIALALGKKSPERVLLLDPSKNDDCTALLGLSVNTFRENEGHYGITVKGVTPNELKGMLSIGDYDFVVIDAGMEMTRQYGFGFPDLRVQVVRNEYLSLRAASIAFPMIPPDHMYDACVVLYQSANALTVRDVQTVLRNVPTTFPMSPSVARSIDAGLYGSQDKHWGEWTTDFIETHLAEAMK